MHCCACRLWEERKKQEIDEVDEGQDIVPEEASCRTEQDKCRKLDQNKEKLAAVIKQQDLWVDHSKHTQGYSSHHKKDDKKPQNSGPRLLLKLNCLQLVPGCQEISWSCICTFLISKKFGLYNMNIFNLKESDTIQLTSKILIIVNTTNPVHVFTLHRYCMFVRIYLKSIFFLLHINIL